MKISKIIVFLYLLFISNNLFSQNLYGGIEIGSKGLKVYIVDKKNNLENDFEIKSFWSSNISIQRGIVYQSELLTQDIESTGKDVLVDYNKLITEYNIDKEKIYVFISSGVSAAKNINDLVAKIKDLTSILAIKMNSETESRYLFKACVLNKNLNNSIVIDLGGGSTSVGFMKLKNEKPTFNSINIDTGTVALSESIFMNAINPSAKDFTKLIDTYKPELQTKIKTKLDSEPILETKTKVYLTGGSPWAFSTLTNKGDVKEKYSEFKLKDVQEYDLLLRNKFNDFKELAKTNEEVALVLSTYSNENLIAANTILLTTLKNLKKIADKKLYYVKQSEISWLVSFIVEIQNN